MLVPAVAAKELHARAASAIIVDQDPLSQSGGHKKREIRRIAVDCPLFGANLIELTVLPTIWTVPGTDASRVR
jgi:hypothetical protein